MQLTTHLTTTTALVVSLAAAPLFAQETDTMPEAQSETSQTTSGDNASSGNSDSDMASDGATTGEDMVVVRVGEADIRGSDISQVISILPPQMQQQPPEILVPMAVNQLIARELILRAAMAENLDEDPEVAALVEESRMANEQDAMVQIWLQRELGARVTNSDIQAKYDEIKANSEQEIPPLDAVSAQIEQQLRQEAFMNLEEDLRQDVEIVYYGPDGKPQTVSSD